MYMYVPVYAYTYIWVRFKLHTGGGRPCMSVPHKDVHPQTLQPVNGAQVFQCIWKSLKIKYRGRDEKREIVLNEVAYR